MRAEFAAFRAILMRDFRMYMSFRSALFTQAITELCVSLRLELRGAAT